MNITTIPESYTTNIQPHFTTFIQIILKKNHHENCYSTFVF
jgi:hypothetical protein